MAPKENTVNLLSVTLEDIRRALAKYASKKTLGKKRAFDEIDQIQTNTTNIYNAVNNVMNHGTALKEIHVTDPFVFQHPAKRLRKHSLGSVGDSDDDDDDGPGPPDFGATNDLTLEWLGDEEMNLGLKEKQYMTEEDLLQRLDNANHRAEIRANFLRDKINESFQGVDSLIRTAYNKLQPELSDLLVRQIQNNANQAENKSTLEGIERVLGEMLAEAKNVFGVYSDNFTRITERFNNSETAGIGAMQRLDSIAGELLLIRHGIEKLANKVDVPIPPKPYLNHAAKKIIRLRTNTSIKSTVNQPTGDVGVAAIIPAPVNVDPGIAAIIPAPVNVDPGIAAIIPAPVNVDPAVPVPHPVVQPEFIIKANPYPLTIPYTPTPRIPVAEHLYGSNLAMRRLGMIIDETPANPPAPIPHPAANQTVTQLPGTAQLPSTITSTTVENPNLAYRASQQVHAQREREDADLNSMFDLMTERNRLAEEEVQAKHAADRAIAEQRALAAQRQIEDVVAQYKNARLDYEKKTVILEEAEKAMRSEKTQIVTDLFNILKGYSAQMEGRLSTIERQNQGALTYDQLMTVLGQMTASIRTEIADGLKTTTDTYNSQLTAIATDLSQQNQAGHGVIAQSLQSTVQAIEQLQVRTANDNNVLAHATVQALDQIRQKAETDNTALNQAVVKIIAGQDEAANRERARSEQFLVSMVASMQNEMLQGFLVAPARSLYADVLAAARNLTTFIPYMDSTQIDYFQQVGVRFQQRRLSADECTAAIHNLQMIYQELTRVYVNKYAGATNDFPISVIAPHMETIVNLVRNNVNRVQMGADGSVGVRTPSDLAREIQANIPGLQNADFPLVLEMVNTLRENIHATDVDGEARRQNALSLVHNAHVNYGQNSQTANIFQQLATNYYDGAGSAQTIKHILAASNIEGDVLRVLQSNEDNFNEQGIFQLNSVLFEQIRRRNHLDLLAESYFAIEQVRGLGTRMEDERYMFIRSFKASIQISSSPGNSLAVMQNVNNNMERAANSLPIIDTDSPAFRGYVEEPDDNMGDGSSAPTHSITPQLAVLGPTLPSANGSGYITQEGVIPKIAEESAVATTQQIEATESDTILTGPRTLQADAAINAGSSTSAMVINNPQAGEAIARLISSSSSSAENILALIRETSRMIVDENTRLPDYRRIEATARQVDPEGINESLQEGLSSLKAITDARSMTSPTLIRSREAIPLPPPPAPMESDNPFLLGHKRPASNRNKGPRPKQNAILDSSSTSASEYDSDSSRRSRSSREGNGLSNAYRYYRGVNDLPSHSTSAPEQEGKGLARIGCNICQCDEDLYVSKKEAKDRQCGPCIKRRGMGTLSRKSAHSLAYEPIESSADARDYERQQYAKVRNDRSVNRLSMFLESCKKYFPAVEGAVAQLTHILYWGNDAHWKDFDDRMFILCVGLITHQPSSNSFLDYNLQIGSLMYAQKHGVNSLNEYENHLSAINASDLSTYDTISDLLKTKPGVAITFLSRH